MPRRGPRREFVASFRLLGGDERRLFLGLLLGAVGYLIWLAGTGVATDRFVQTALGPVSIDPWSGRATLLTLVYLFLWVVGPSLLAVYLVVGEVTNIRGNIEKRYRFDQPLFLLVPPVIGVVLVLLVAVAQGSFGVWTQLALGLASVFLLVRTVAYGYRVYSLSVPRFLQGLLFLGAWFVSLAVAVQTAEMGGQEALVRAATERYGLSSFAYGTADLGAFSAPVVVLAGATMPAIVGLTYVWFQIMASLIVRIHRPDVPRSAIRAGQRYPSVIQPGTSDRLAMGTVPEDEDADADGTESDADEPDDAERDDRVGHTRVYTPPEEGDPVEESTEVVGGASVKSELCPICGATYAADADPTHCPNCNAVLQTE